MQNFRDKNIIMKKIKVIFVKFCGQNIIKLKLMGFSLKRQGSRISKNLELFFLKEIGGISSRRIDQVHGLWSTTLIRYGPLKS
jgi:hypothetical protein